MSLLLPDTAALIAAQRGTPDGLGFLRSLAANDDILVTLDIVVAEFYTGARVGEHPAIDELLRSARYVETTFEIAYEAGQYRNAFARRGIQLAVTDAMIAAAARATGAHVVTSNVRDFPQDDITVIPLSSFGPPTLAPDPSRG